MTVPHPTPILRLIHIDNLALCLARGGLHAPNHQPGDGLEYRAIHSLAVQASRHDRAIPCGPGGSMHDYVPFYFGPLSPMMLNLKTGRVAGYQEGQEPLIYLVSTAQKVQESGAEFVFSDGHGLAAFTEWFEDLDFLGQIDWQAVKARYWADTANDMDRQRKKQAEFLVHRFCPLGTYWENFGSEPTHERARRGGIGWVPGGAENGCFRAPGLVLSLDGGRVQ